MVLTRSCTALAALVIHRVTHSWPDAIQDIVQNFQNIDFPNVSMENKCMALLEILTGIFPRYLLKLSLAQIEFISKILKSNTGRVSNMSIRQNSKTRC